MLTAPRTALAALVAAVALMPAPGHPTETGAWVPRGHQQAADGFTVTESVQIAAEPGAVWTALVDDVGRWWSPDHTLGGDAAALSIDARPQGCFCEELPAGGATHLTVVHVDRPRLLRMSGGLGPLQEHAVTGSLTLGLVPVDGATRVDLVYRVSGHVEGGLGGWADPVAAVLREQIQRLRSFVETGSPRG